MPVPELRFWAGYFAKVPPPEERIEIAVARLEAMYVNGHRDKKTTPQPLAISDFLTFHKAFDQQAAKVAGSDRYTDADRAMLRELMR